MTEEERVLLRRAYEAGYEQGLAGVWYADATTPYKDWMFEQWLETIQSSSTN